MLELQPIRKRALCILTILVCCLFLIFLRRDDDKAVSCPFALKQLQMCSEKTGWGLSAENGLLYTENGIENMNLVRTFENVNNTSDRSINAVFLNEQTAYVAYFTSDRAQLVVEYTKDGGASWQQTYIKYGEYDAGSVFLSFADDRNGYLLYCSTPALGQMTKLLFVTDNAGQTFTFAEDLTGTIAGYPQGITAVTKDQILLAVTYHGVDSYLYQSFDRARTWKSVEIFSRTDDVRYVDGYAPVFYDSDRQKGVILLKVMRENTAYELFTTENAGQQWTSDGEIPCDSLYSCSVSSDGQLYVIDQSGNLYLRP